MKHLALVCLMALGACAGNPKVGVVAIVTSSVLVVPMDTAETGVLGRTNCDLTNQAYVLINMRLNTEGRKWVLAHERAHVEQVRASGVGCYAYMERYRKDPLFRLRTEGEAFCMVWYLQKQTGAPLSPDVPTIVQMLLKYPESAWTEEEVRNALVCASGNQR